MDKVKMMLVLVLHLVIMLSFSGCYSDQLNRTTDADISDYLQLETAEQIDFDFDALLSFISQTGTSFTRMLILMESIICLQLRKVRRKNWGVRKIFC